MTNVMTTVSNPALLIHVRLGFGPEWVTAPGRRYVRPRHLYIALLDIDAVI
jgi:hypothetical protein